MVVELVVKINTTKTPAELIEWLYDRIESSLEFTIDGTISTASITVSEVKEMIR